MQLSVPNNLCMKHPRRCNIHTYIDVYCHAQLTLLRRLYYPATKFDLICRLSSGHYTRTWMLTETKYVLALRLYSFVFRFLYLWIISCFAQIIFTWSIPVGVTPKCLMMFQITHLTLLRMFIYHLVWVLGVGYHKAIILQEHECIQN
jgi:hypothetical protein